MTINIENTAEILYNYNKKILLRDSMKGRG